MGKTIHTLWANPWSMAGTEGTYAYDVRAASLRGRVGVRVLKGTFGTHFRIRVEPISTASSAMIAKMAKLMPREHGWKQPGDDDQHRFSIVTDDKEAADVAIMAAEIALGEATLASFERKPLEATSNEKADA